ncbi:hypothetical protein, partial [Microbulbifer celer]
MLQTKKMHNKQRQSDSQRYAPFVLLAGAQTLTQNALRAGCACAGRYVSYGKMKNRAVPITVSIVVLVALSVLFGVAYEEWDGLCGHKEEFGLFPFYRIGIPSDPSG